MKKILLIFLLAISIFAFSETFFDGSLIANAECVESDGDPGLVPCGKSTNYTSTAWDECKPCNLCSLILMCQIIIEFLVKISAVFATLTIVFGGLLYVFAGGQSTIISRAKTIIKYSLIGFTIVFIAWAIIDSILMTMGYIDPVAGDWYTIC